MKTSVLKPFGLPTVAIILLIPMSIHPATDSLVPSIEAYFSTLNEEVNRNGATTIVKNAPGAQLRGYFAAVMKRNPTIRSLMKVDARGRVVCERIRGKKNPPQRRSVAGYGCFIQTAKSLKEYQCVIKEENGAAALYWSVPLLRNGPGGRRFNGALIAIVDLRACFRAIAKAGAPPFLIRLDEKKFYAHSWNNALIFNESPINIPGVENVTVRYQNSNVSVFVQPESDTLQQTSIAAAPKDSQTISPTAMEIAVPAEVSPPLKAAVQASANKNIPVLIGLAALILIVSVLLVLQIAGRINLRRTGLPREEKDLLKPPPD